MNGHIRSLHHTALILLVLSALPGLQGFAVWAREQTGAGFMAADEEMVQRLLHVRTREELVTELESARQRLAAARASLAEFEEIGSVVRARVAVKRQEIELIRQRARLSKKEGDASREAELSSQRKQEEKQLEVFEAMRDASAAQIGRARAARDFSQSRITLQELELSLVEKRESRIAHATGVSDLKQQEDLDAMDREIRTASRKVLASIRDYARRSEQLAKATETLARSNLRLLDVWEEYSAR